MKLYMKRKIFLFIFMFMGLFLMEMTMNILIFKQFYTTHFLLELSLYLIILCPIFFTKNNLISIVYSAVIYLLCGILMLVNLLLNYASSDVFSLKYLSLFGAMTEVVNGSFIQPLYISLFVIFILSYPIMVFMLYKFIYKDLEKKYSYSPVLIGLIMLAIGLIGRSISLNQIKSDKEKYGIYQGQSGVQIVETSATLFKRDALKSYGLFGYSFAEISSLLPKGKQDFPVGGEPPSLGGEYSDYTGLLKDYNVITIMIETGVPFLIHPVLTPTLYSLQQEGLNLTKHYSKNKTNVSEFIGLVGSTPSSGEINQSGGYNVWFSSVSLMNQAGYVTKYFHDNTKEFYNREEEMTKLGFQQCFFAEDVNPESIAHSKLWNGSYPLDTEFMSLVLEEMAPEGDVPFYSFWTTLSTHGPYNFRYGSNIKKFRELKYYERIHNAEQQGLWVNTCADEEIEIQQQIEYIQCAMMDLDQAMSMLLNRLDAIGKRDNTLIIMYGDHDCYYATNNRKPLKNYIYNIDDEPLNPVQYETINIFYNEKLTEFYKEDHHLSIDESATFDDFTSPYVIVPTLLDLLGIHYQPNRYVGISIFRVQTPLDNIFYSHELNIIFSDLLTIEQLEDYKYDYETDEKYKRLFNECAGVVLYKIYLFNQLYLNNSF